VGHGVGGQVGVAVGIRGHLLDHLGQVGRGGVGDSPFMSPPQALDSSTDGLAGALEVTSCAVLLFHRQAAARSAGSLEVASILSASSRFCWLMLLVMSRPMLPMIWAALMVSWVSLSFCCSC
jgi:hypothetical protein